MLSGYMDWKRCVRRDFTHLTSDRDWLDGKGFVRIIKLKTMEIDILKLSLQERGRLFSEELQPFMDSLNKKYNIALQANIQLLDTTKPEEVKVEEPKKEEKK